MYCGVDALRLLHKISDVSTDLDFEFYNKHAINHSLRVLSVFVEVPICKSRMFSCDYLSLSRTIIA